MMPIMLSLQRRASIFWNEIKWPMVTLTLVGIGLTLLLHAIHAPLVTLLWIGMAVLRQAVP